MKSLLLLVIRVYWITWPAAWRRRCLYRESCSRYVHRITAAEGLGAGLRALRSRVRTCRPGYAVVRCEGHTWLALGDGSLLEAEEVAPRLLATD
ncbi:membrane protein insertion efficiency factor YidD [Longimicrobium sp.]|uniref:membrane protein insertion efficiency factor YidD n=1 Tax=Longimicrobium sp. TaxID=2029185 RepID=UPI0039C9520D